MNSFDYHALKTYCNSFLSHENDSIMQGDMQVTPAEASSHLTNVSQVLTQMSDVPFNSQQAPKSVRAKSKRNWNELANSELSILHNLEDEQNCSQGSLCETKGPREKEAILKVLQLLEDFCTHFKETNSKANLNDIYEIKNELLKSLRKQEKELQALTKVQSENAQLKAELSELKTARKKDEFWQKSIMQEVIPKVAKIQGRKVDEKLKSLSKEHSEEINQLKEKIEMLQQFLLRFKAEQRHVKCDIGRSQQENFRSLAKCVTKLREISDGWVQEKRQLEKKHKLAKKVAEIPEVKLSPLHGKSVWIVKPLKQTEVLFLNQTDVQIFKVGTQSETNTASEPDLKDSSEICMCLKINGKVKKVINQRMLNWLDSDTDSDYETDEGLGWFEEL